MLRPVRERSQAAIGRLVILSDDDRPALEKLIDRDPIVNAMAGARLQASRSLAPARLGATAVGVAAADGLVAGALDGANLIPIGGNAEAWPILASYLALRSRRCSSILGQADAVAALWPRLSAAWGPARAVRACQPLLISDRSAAPADDDRLCVLNPSQLEAYLPAAAAMFAEELGISPLTAARSAGYRRRAEHLLQAGRAFGILDRSGSVAFKADIGALTGHTCQIQGVWVRPDLRGRGLGAAAMSAVLARGLALAPTVSLYVNDFNVAARALYARLGMRQVAELSTILF